MKHGTTCKFCRKPITLEIADDYAELGDPFKLIPAACCNHCADLRMERRSIEAKIKFICMGRFFDQKGAVANKSKHRESLETLMKQYANLISRFHFLQGMCWDEEALDLILDKPQHWPAILKTMWKQFDESNPQRVVAQP